MIAKSAAFAIERSTSGIAGAGDLVSEHPTPASGLKALKRISQGGRDRDLILVERATGKVIARSLALNKTCLCGHDTLAHVPRCSSCPCLRHEERREEPSRILQATARIFSPW